MLNKTIVINYIDNMIYFFFCVLCFFLPISNALISVSFGFIFVLYLIKFLFIIPDGTLFEKLFLDKLSLYVIIFIFSIGLSIFVSGGLIGKSFHAWYAKWLEGVLLFYFSYFIFRKNSIKIILVIFVLSTILICINGIFQKINGVDFIRHHELIHSYDRFSICSTFNHYNSLASFLVTMFFVIFGLILNNIRLSKTRVVLKNIFLYLTIFLTLYCIIFTFSKAGWLSLVLGLFLMMLIFFFYKLNKIILFSFFRFILVIIILLFLVPYVRENFYYLTIVKIQGRSIFIREALSMFMESPILGKGIGTFINRIPDNFYIKHQYAHNSYLQLLVEVGIIGFLPFLLILIQWFKESLRFIKTHKDNFVFLGLFCGIFAYLIHALFDNQLFSLKLATLFWFLLGLSSSFHKRLNNNKIF